MTEIDSDDEAKDTPLEELKAKQSKERKELQGLCRIQQSGVQS
jgi:hypothetical protein